MKTKIWAHRGASAYAPENTMQAFQLAREMGADGFELDVHLTKDGHLVVAHDETVDRCSDGTGRIIDKTLKQLSELDFSKGFSRFSPARIPSLLQVLEYARDYDLTVNIELKTDRIMYRNIEKKAIELVNSLNMRDKVIFSSFNHYSIKLVKQIEPSANIGILYTEAMIDPCLYACHLKAEAIHPYYLTLMVPETVVGCKKHNVKIHTWTVNDKEHIAWLVKEGVDAIITDCPDVAVRTRNMLQNKRRRKN